MTEVTPHHWFQELSAIWKPIPFLPSRYEASDTGLIRTLPYTLRHTSPQGKACERTVAGRLLKPKLSKEALSGGKHPVVCVNLGGGSREHNKKRLQRVCRLVAAAWHGMPFDPSDQSQVHRWRIRHRDGDLLNCTAENLEWVPRAGTTTAGYGDNRLVWENTDPADVLGRLFAEDAA